MQSDNEQNALSRIRDYLERGHSLEGIREAGWGTWLDYFEAKGIDVGTGPGPESSQPEDGPQDDNDPKDYSDSTAEIDAEWAKEKDSLKHNDAHVKPVEARYGALAIISTALRVLGWLVITGGIIASVLFAFGAFATTSESTDDGFAAAAALFAIAGVISSVVYGVILIAVAELIRLMIDLERNTRATALYLVDRE